MVSFQGKWIDIASIKNINIKHAVHCCLHADKQQKLHYKL